MLFRNLRWTVAGIAAVVALCSSPARSRADVQILVEELNASGSVVGSSGYTVGTPSGSTTFFQNFSYSSPNGYFTLSGTVGTNSQLGTINASLSTSFTGGFTSNFNPSQGHTLQIIVTDDGFSGNGQSSTLLNSAGASQGFVGGTIDVASASSVYNPNTSTSVPASSTTQLASGPSLGGPTPTASDSLPSSGTNNQETQSNISGLPDTYAIQQVINISFTQTGSIDPDSTFGGTAGARIIPTIDTVPAPGGLALALVGLPLIGLRHALRKRGVV
jgi:hypothetical protein